MLALWWSQALGKAGHSKYVWVWLFFGGVALLVGHLHLCCCFRLGGVNYV